MHLYVTHTGFVDFGPDAAIIGDFVALLDGCSAPVLLRPTGKEKEYTFRGPAYILGAMGQDMEQFMQGLLPEAQMCRLA
jgi:hypothetical protein